ncbi:MAG: TIGR00159 family protein, partial [Bacteroidetes bacterium]
MEPLLLDMLGLRFWDIMDILLVALILYVLYNFLRDTIAINIFFGIVAIFLLWQLVDALQMQLLKEILGAFVSVGFIALIVVFQPEIRKFLLMLGTPNFYHRHSRRFLFRRVHFHDTNAEVVDILVSACHRLAEKKTGALIILIRKNGLKQFLRTGETLNADLGRQILESIFFKNSPLHDGAVIISGKKIEAARCILPVS